MQSPQRNTSRFDRRRFRQRRDTHEVRSHSGATSLAGDASKAQAEALTEQPQQPLHQTGRVTKLARIFGAGAATCGLLGLTLIGTAVADGPAAPGALLGREAPPFDVPGVTNRHVAAIANPSGTGAWMLETDGSIDTIGAARSRRGMPTDPTMNPAVDLAPSGHGFWILTARGRLTARGGAPTLVGPRPALGARKYVAISALPTGDGAYALRSDGLIEALGRAQHRGDLRGRVGTDRVVDIAVAPSGLGYFVVTARGEVHKFGRVFHDGDPGGFIGPDVVGLATDPDGRGYWIALDTGAVLAYRAGEHRPAFAANTGVSAVEITAVDDRDFWTLQSATVDHMHPFLVCTRSHESSHTPPAYDDGYDAINPSGTYRGAYQFSRSTWNSTAEHAGRPDLVGVDPAAASVVDQDTMALHLYGWQGADPWLGRCAGL